MTTFIIGFLIGAVLGAGVALAVSIARSRAGERQMREAFAALAGEALDANSRRLAAQASEALDGRKQLIDQTVKVMNERLESVRKFLQQVETDRKQDLGRLSGSISSLATTTGELHKMLASTQRRGAWGERMAEDILRLVGMTEGVNYAKQSGEAAEGQERPDFTFFLPNDLKVNMDVKFPLERYKAWLDAETDAERQTQLAQLVTAVRNHIRAVAGRGYIDPKAPTVPYVIVFVPSEQIYSLVLEASPDLIDEALGKSVVLASPLTLYAMLAVMRQAAENVNVMKTADEVLSLLGDFYKQWQKYNEEVDRLGSQLGTVNKTYENLRTTRSNTLQKPLDRIEDLRQSRNLPDVEE